MANTPKTKQSNTSATAGIRKYFSFHFFSMVYGFIQWRLLWEPDAVLFKDIIIKQEIIQSDMQYAIFIIPRFHWSF